jgi:hypothetical protein
MDGKRGGESGKVQSVGVMPSRFAQRCIVRHIRHNFDCMPPNRSGQVQRVKHRSNPENKKKSLHADKDASRTSFITVSSSTSQVVNQANLRYVAMLKLTLGKKAVQSTRIQPTWAT